MFNNLLTKLTNLNRHWHQINTRDQLLKEIISWLQLLKELVKKEVMLQKKLNSQQVQKSLEYILPTKREKIKHQRKNLQSINQKKNLKRNLSPEEENLIKMILLMSLLVQTDKFKKSMEKNKQNKYFEYQKYKWIKSIDHKSFLLLCLLEFIN